MRTEKQIVGRIESCEKSINNFRQEIEDECLGGLSTNSIKRIVQESFIKSKKNRIAILREKIRLLDWILS